MRLCQFGFFATLIWNDKIKNCGIFALILSIVIVIIEILQYLFRVGSADIDDVILNVTGAVIVYLIMQIKVVRKTIDKILE